MAASAGAVDEAIRAGHGSIAARRNGQGLASRKKLEERTVIGSACPSQSVKVSVGGLQKPVRVTAIGSISETEQRGQTAAWGDFENCAAGCAAVIPAPCGRAVKGSVGGLHQPR